MTELIPGMNDIINHIKSLEEENTSLKKIITELKNYNEANIKLRHKLEDELKIIKDEPYKMKCITS